MHFIVADVILENYLIISDYKVIKTKLKKYF